MTKISTKCRKQAILLGGLTLVLIILVYFFFQSGGDERELIKQSDTSGQGSKPEPPVAGETLDIRVYFQSEEDGLLHPEARSIPADPSAVRQAEAVIAELIKGSEKGYLATIPPETRLRQLFITQDGTAYVDFSREFVEKHPSGTSAEVATIYSVVNSLAFNIPSVKRVFFLVEGGEKETLGGHINLSKPFTPLKSVVVE